MPAVSEPISYDEVPYPGAALSETHPSNLAVIATLFGLQPALPSRCRVLELGCATGGNLLPMAELLPGSDFVGIDLSGVQIGMARSRARQLGLPRLAGWLEADLPAASSCGSGCGTCGNCGTGDTQASTPPEFSITPDALRRTIRKQPTDASRNLSK